MQSAGGFIAWGADVAGLNSWVAPSSIGPARPSRSRAIPLPRGGRGKTPPRGGWSCSDLRAGAELEFEPVDAGDGAALVAGGGRRGGDAQEADSEGVGAGRVLRAADARVSPWSKAARCGWGGVVVGGMRFGEDGWRYIR